MLKLDISQILSSVATGFAKRTAMIQDFFKSPYTELSKQTKEVAKSLTYPKIPRWQYLIDASLGLKILKSEKDPEALDHVRQIADELFK